MFVFKVDECREFLKLGSFGNRHFTVTPVETVYSGVVLLRGVYVRVFHLRVQSFYAEIQCP